MAAKIKAEEDICEEVIILEVESQILNLIEQGVECISYDNMSLSEKKQFDLQKRIEELELDGVARVFSDNEDFRKNAWNFWKKATLLRERNEIPKNLLPQSEWEEIAFNSREFQTSEDLFRLFPEEQLRWKMQAFFTFQRISRKYNCFPDSYIVQNLFQFALQGWEDRGFTRRWAFAISLYLFELFGKTEFLHQLVSKPSESKDVVHSTFTEFVNILQHPQRNQLDSTERDTVMTFDHFMTSLEFSFAYQIKVRDHAPNRQSKTNLDLKIKSKVVKLKDISKLILIILELLVSLPKSENESCKLRSKLRDYLVNYGWINQRPNLLLEVCTSFEGKTSQFKLIKLLLEAGANPNAVDKYHRSPLHILASKERSRVALWSQPNYSTQADYFIALVRIFLDGRFHEDQVNLRGQSALECLLSSKLLLMYPNPEICQIVGNFLTGISPLSCLAAQAIRRHKLPCESLPMLLKYMVLHHKH
ncbi:hypothetical protein DAPPUDRAFT_332992 [Daphnia pulex]|nr:hypothetical protein DAPPUDRAFT_332992 [Daphnia pulex]|eukprot:EFX65618.1 hypothetical protein DAPPUDRAFT_332992 [Daphnia pulex]